MTTQRLIAVAGLMLMLAAARPAEAATSTKTLLEGLRKAMLSRPVASITSLHSSGTIEVLGLKGTEQEWDDLRGARFTSSQIAGALTGSSGWDGKVAWSQDYAGLVTIDGGEAGRLQSIDQAYFDNLRFLRADAGGATIVYAGSRVDGGKNYEVLAVTPPQGSEVDLWIDPQTHLIARQTATIGVISFTTTFSKYRRVDGVTYPFSTLLETSTGNSSAVHVSTLEVNADVAERMRLPASTPRDASIVKGPSTTVPIQVVNNHVYVNAMLDGKGPYAFILDSGGDYIVTPEVAKALAAQSSGGMQLGGVGDTTEGASFTQVESLQVGNATVRNPYMIVLPIGSGFGMAEGMQIDGMIGYQFLARFLTTIDYADGKMTLTMPQQAPAAAPGAAPIGFFFDGTIPRIPIAVNGVLTTGEIDTGSRGGLTLSTPFVAAHPQIAALAKIGPGVEGFGVGGPSYAKLGRIPAIQIGPYWINNSVAAFGTQDKGAMADPYNPANVGGGILRRFDVTFDYAHHQLLFAKNGTFDTPPAFDRSGLFLIDKAGEYTVISVFPGSPGAASGVAKGDVIVSVNGNAASSTSLAALRALLSGQPGTVLRLHVRGAQGERDVTVTLADYV